jgi:hypothetical protein
MIPERKKTPEEIAALREGLGIPGTPEPPKNPPLPAVAPPSRAPVPSPIYTPNPPSAKPAGLPESDQALYHLDIQPLPAPTAIPKPHSLRKHDLPLAPAPPVTQKTALPEHRHDPRDIAQIRKREALAKLNSPGTDPAAHLRKQTAHPVLYIPGYLLALSAAILAYQRAHHFTPIVLLALSLAITLYIAIRKPRSRHHAALIFIIIFLTAAFGGIHYAPLFRNGP